MGSEPEAMMNEVGSVADKADVLQMLQEGMEALADALRGFDASLARRRSNSGAWSVVECVEHLTLTERALLLRLKEAKVCDESHEDRAREAKFQDLALNRARRIDAPEPVRLVPSPRCPTERASSDPAIPASSNTPTIHTAVVRRDRFGSPIDSAGRCSSRARNTSAARAV